MRVLLFDLSIHFISLIFLLFLLPYTLYFLDVVDNKPAHFRWGAGPLDKKTPPHKLSYSRGEKGKVDWCTSSFYWQTHNGELQGSKRNDYIHSCNTRTKSWCQNQSILFSLTRIPLNWKEHVFHTGGSSNYKNNPRDWSMGKRNKSEKHETSLFILSSKSPRFLVKTPDERLDRSSSWAKNGTVQAKLSPRSWLFVFIISIFDELKMQIQHFRK